MTFSDIGSNPLPIELRLPAGPEEFESAMLADRVGPVEDPILPGRETAEDLGLHRLAPGEAQARLHAGEGVGRQAGTLFDGEADLVLPIELVRRHGDEAESEGRPGVEHLAILRRDAVKRAAVAVETRGQPRH